MAFSYNTTHREQRLMAATPEALETECSSIQRSAYILAVNQLAGSVDAGGAVIERELIDWRVDTFNRTLEQRPDLSIQPIEGTVVHAEAAERARERQQAAQESYRQQFPKQAHELVSAQPDPIALVPGLLAEQEKTIREEWLSDLQAGRLNQHALDSYFAGRVDQHNALIEMAVTAHPELQTTLPPLIEYSEMRNELQQRVNQHSLHNRGAEIARMETRYLEQVSEQQGFGLAV